MSNEYVPPTQVMSPKRRWTLVSLLYDEGEGGGAVAIGYWDGVRVLAMRWNGDDQSQIGNPQSRGLPTWFIVPRHFSEAILTTLEQLAPGKGARAREFFIEAVVLTNTIARPDCRKSIQEAVVEGIGPRLFTETWTVRIYEPQSGPQYVVKITGPNDFTWERTFFGPHEQTPEFIGEEVRKATR